MTLVDCDLHTRIFTMHTWRPGVWRGRYLLRRSGKKSTFKMMASPRSYRPRNCQVIHIPSTFCGAFGGRPAELSRDASKSLRRNTDVTGRRNWPPGAIGRRVWSISAGDKYTPSQASTTACWISVADERPGFSMTKVYVQRTSPVAAWSSRLRPSTLHVRGVLECQCGAPA